MDRLEKMEQSIRALNYNAGFTYAVKAVPELSDIVNHRQIQVVAQQQQIDWLIHVLLSYDV